jgi:hypothetical protein
MLSHKPFYYQSIRKIVAAFGTLFNDMQIERTNSAGDVVKTLKIPLIYGPKEKWFIRGEQDPGAGDISDETGAKRVQVTWPRMSYEMVGMNYDSNRKLTSTGMNVITDVDSNRVLKSQYNPVPWNITFALHIGARNNDDALAILEQILPFFTPDFTVTLQEMVPLNLRRDIPFVFNAMTPDIDYNGDFTTIRKIAWTLVFTAKAFLYQPVIKSKIIIDSTVNIIAESPDPTRSGRAVINTVPDPIDAQPDDDWTYNTTITDPADAA